MPNGENEVEFSLKQYPGVDNEGEYSERLLVDYRWYDAHNVTPAFPFGHGLSYTNWEYSSFVSTKARIFATVKNTGSMAGAEVNGLNRPPRLPHRLIIPYSRSTCVPGCANVPCFSRVGK